MKKQTTAIILLFAILLAGCGGTEGTNTMTSAADAETISAEPRDGLPEDLDFGGAEVKLHASLWMGVTKDPLAEYYIEEENGDIVNDAVYQRNCTVEDRLNVRLAYTWNETVWDTHDEELSFYISSIMAGDDAFDAVFYIAHLLPSVAVSGFMHNLADMKYIDLSQPWWAQMYNSAATVGGKLYFATGDIALGNYLHSYCMFFNHALIDTLKLENPYDLVDSGKWTLDKLRSMSVASYSDLNGNAAADKDDRFGLVVEGENIISGFMESSKVNIIEIAKDGMSGEYVFGNEHNVNVVEKVRELLFDSEGVLYVKDSSGYANEYIFTKGNVVFTGGWFGDTDYYREMNFDYGIIPYPKYDEAQDDYYSRIGTACPVVAVPVTTDNPDMVSAVLEVMAAEGYYQIRPAYFDMALKNKYSRDEKTKDMVDKIIENVTVDFGTIFVYSLNNISDKFKNTIKKNQSDWVSNTETWKSQVMASLDTLLGTLNGD